MSEQVEHELGCITLTILLAAVAVLSRAFEHIARSLAGIAEALAK